MSYCYRCKICGREIEQSTRTAPFRCPSCGAAVSLVRDYRAENAGIGAGVRTSRDQGVSEARVMHQWAEEAAG